ncbi:MAG: DHH family phosphoesterase, partial [Firmicutes bacterium]|nr:DHH family phosphoesterase [Bacillota bacterium]
MNEIIRQLLSKRGIVEEQDIIEYLSPRPRTSYDPRLLYGMKEAVDTILAAVRRGDKIVVYGDYDADGVTATVIMMTILRALGAKAPSFYIPSRFDEGYGLNENAIEKLAELGVDMIVTVDCGAVSYFEVETAKEYGITVVVTDHHNCSDGLADTIVLDPKQPDETYPYKDLAGCGVAYKLALALRDAAGLDKKITNGLLDMVAVGTVADVVPLTGENRSLVKYGLHKINTGDRIGLNMLIDRIYRKPGDPAWKRYPIDSGRIGFGIGPHINAAGRMGDASLGVRLFLAKTPEEAYPYVEKLYTLTQERKGVQDKTERDLIAYCGEELDNDLFPVLIPQTSHEGT